MIILTSIITDIALILATITMCMQNKKIKTLRELIEYAVKEDEKNQNLIEEYKQQAEEVYSELKKYQDMVEKAKAIDVKVDGISVTKKAEEKAPAKRGRKPGKKEEKK